MLIEPVCQSDVLGAILGAVSGSLKVQAFMELLEGTDNKEMMIKGEKAYALCPGEGGESRPH